VLSIMGNVLHSEHSHAGVPAVGSHSPSPTQNFLAVVAFSI